MAQTNIQQYNQRLFSLSCLISPEKDKWFDYLNKYFKFNLPDQSMREELVKQEKYIS